MKQVGELASPSMFIPKRSGGLYFTSFVLEFVSKIRNLSVLDSRFEGVVIPSLYDFVGDDEREMSFLCSVSCQLFLCRTHSLGATCLCLFVSYGQIKEICGCG